MMREYESCLSVSEKNKQFFLFFYFFLGNQQTRKPNSIRIVVNFSPGPFHPGMTFMLTASFCCSFARNAPIS